MRLQPVNHTAKSIIDDLRSKGYSDGEIAMALSIAKQAIKKAAQ